MLQNNNKKTLQFEILDMLILLKQVEILSQFQMVKRLSRNILSTSLVAPAHNMSCKTSNGEEKCTCFCSGYRSALKTANKAIREKDAQWVLK
jgi:hypothetical protein